MILGFSTQISGKPTYFVEKIWNSFDQEFAIDNFDKYFDIDEGYIFHDQGVSFHPKGHTIRNDPKNRWKKGKNIDFFINVRRKNMFRFAPVLPVVSTQRIFMTYYHSDIIQISVDNRELWGHEREKLALNDGFNSWEDFFNYFYPIIQASEDKCFSGKIIHWTDLRY